MKTNPHCIKAIVSGKVQGVFFRDRTQKKARALKLTGWVRNTEDGNVEVIACGEHTQLMEFTEWLWVGSERSNVTNVEWDAIDAQDFSDFVIG